MQVTQLFAQAQNLYHHIWSTCSSHAFRVYSNINFAQPSVCIQLMSIKYKKQTNQKHANILFAMQAKL